MDFINDRIQLLSTIDYIIDDDMKHFDVLFYLQCCYFHCVLCVGGSRIDDDYFDCTMTKTYYNVLLNFFPLFLFHLTATRNKICREINKCMHLNCCFIYNYISK